MADTVKVKAQQNGDVEQTEAVEENEHGAGDASAADNPDDDDDRKVFVGGLSWETTQKDLKEYFSTFGEISSCTLKTDLDTKRSRGFGFVVFEDVASVEKVLEKTDHMLHQRKIDPKRAKPRGAEPIKKIFVGKLDPAVSEADVREYFSKFGKIEKVDLPFDKIKDQRRAFCFIEYDSVDAVTKAIEEETHKLGGQELDVKKATPQSGRGRGRGFGAWGFAGGRGGRGGRSRGGWGPGYGPGYYGGWGNQGYYDYYDYYGGYDQGYYPGYGGGWDYNQGYYGVLKAARKGANKSGSGKRRGGGGAAVENSTPTATTTTTTTTATEQENGNK